MPNDIKLQNISQNDGLKREIEFWEVFFLSIGGQAPFLSLLTYTTVVIVLTKEFAPVIVLIGTIVVLLNGLVVAYLARRFTSTGGYFNYAYYGLSKRLGLETGIVYTYYSTLYGSAYVAGATFLVNYLLHINVWYAYLLSIIPASAFLVIGIRPSTKYAIFAAIMEIAIFIVTFFYSVVYANFHFYNPLSASYYGSLSTSAISLGILYAMGIPTGYGSITPVSGEVKRAEKNIGRAAISVIIVGGVLNSILIYGLLNGLLWHGQISDLTQSRVPIVSEILRIIGPWGYYILLFTVINDGILSVLSFMLASSRNIYAMSLRSLIPKIFSVLRNSNPIMASFLTIALYVLVTYPMILKLGPFHSFIILGALAGMGNLFIHISANFSLIKINIDSMIRRFNEIIVGSMAQVLSLSVLIYSLFSTIPIIAYTFLGFLVIVFVYTELMSMTQKGKSILI